MLIEAGYIPNDHDPCVFNKTIDGTQITVAFHVDDLLVTCTNSKYIDELIEHHLKAAFQRYQSNEVTVIHT